MICIILNIQTQQLGFQGQCRYVERKSLFMVDLGNDDARHMTHMYTSSCNVRNSEMTPFQNFHCTSNSSVLRKTAVT